MPRAATATRPAPIEYPSRRKQRAERAHLRLAVPPKARPSAEVAAERIRTLILEIGDDMYRRQWGWRRRVYAHLGISESYGHLLLNGKQKRVGTDVMDKICHHIGCSIADLMDET